LPARISRIDLLLVDDWAMAPLIRNGTPAFPANLRGALTGRFLSAM
jgi:hypothetical protein